MKTRIAIGAAGLLLCAAGANAAGPRTDEVVQRDVDQQQRIEQGLQSGALTTREAGKLEHEEARIDRTEARDLKDGALSKSELHQINAMENRASADIYREKHDAQLGHPDSASSERMQADVARNVDQEKRIEQGAKSGTLTNREVGALERGQSHVDAREAHVARNGRVNAAEQGRVQAAENRQSAHVWKRKHS